MRNESTPALEATEENQAKTEHGKDKRWRYIREILSENGILSQAQIANKLRRPPYNLKNVSQGTISRDLTDMKAITTYIKEEKKNHYTLPPDTQAEIDKVALKTICENADISTEDIIEKVGICAINSYGHSFLLADKIKKMYNEDIIETVCYHNVIIIYYDKSSKPKLPQELKLIVPRKEIPPVD